MKLITKLLPLTCVVATASVVAPLTTSCAAGKTQTDSASYSFDYEYNMKKDEIVKRLCPYASKVTPAETVDFDGIDADTANQIYFDKLTEDKSVFADDLLWGFYRNTLSSAVMSGATTYKGNADCHVNSFDSETGKISFSWVVKCDFEKISYSSNADESTQYHIDRTIEINNAPIIVKDRRGGWVLARNTDFDESDLDDFSVKFHDVYGVDDSYNNNDVVWNLDNYESQITTINYAGEERPYNGIQMVNELIEEWIDPIHYLINNGVKNP